MSQTNFSGPVQSAGGFKVGDVTVIDENGKIIESAGIEIADGDSFDDTNGNEVLGFGVVASAVNYLDITNAATGTSPVLAADGSDTNVGMQFDTKGEATVIFNTSGSTPGSNGLFIVNENEGTQGATLVLSHVSTTPSSSDEVGIILGVGKNDAAEDVVYSSINMGSPTVTDGSEEGYLELKAATGGTQFATFIGINSNGDGLTTINRGLVSAKDNIAAGAGGAIGLVTPTTTVNTDAGGDAFTLANGVDGQRKTVIMVVDGGGDAVITPATFANGTTITLDAAGDSVSLEYDSTIGWVVVGGEGYAIA